MNYNLPNVHLGRFGYEGTVLLEVGSGAIKEYRLNVGGDMVESNPTITEQHVLAYEFMVKSQKRIRDTVLEALLREYPQIKADYGDYVSLPSVSNVEDVSQLIELSQVHVMNVSKENIGYVGYEFNCAWDEEHGFGVMMHKDRIVKIGGGDTSFLTWVAKQDIAL